MTPTLAERVHDLVLWARSRIAQCRDQEQRFAVGSLTSDEATQERRTLQAVLRILGQKEEP